MAKLLSRVCHTENPSGTAAGQVAKQNLLGKHIADLFHYQSSQRPCPEIRVIAFGREPVSGCVGEFDFHFLLEQLAFEFDNQFINHLLHRIVIERSEGDGRIEAIPELG